MPKLDELREAFRTGELEPPDEPARPSTGQYKISADGRDALLKFGVHRGSTVSQLLEKDPTYIQWVLKGDFPKELKDVIRYQKKQRFENKIKGIQPDIRKPEELDLSELFK